MNLQPGLSFSQAPPILVPFRFFLSAPLFGLLAALLAFWTGPSLLDGRWQPAVLALTHLMTLGFLGMAMIGAMLQMLPVVAGSPVAHPVGVARAVHWLLIPGVLVLVCGFLLSMPLPMRIAMLLLGGGFTIFIAAAGLSLWRAPSSNPTQIGMRFALTGLLVTVVLGLILASNFGWTWWLNRWVQVTNIHATWGLLGWIGLLVVGVSYQVVPMFQLTPAYPKLMSRWLSRVVFLLLLSGTALYGLPAGKTWTLAMLVIMLLIVAIVGVFAAVTLRLQLQRRRKQPDVTLLFWRFGMTSLLLSLVVGMVMLFMPAWASEHKFNFMMVFLFLAGFAVSVVNGMLYKIVPFLIWFHLQSLLIGITRVPNMKLIMPEPGMRRQMRLHFIAVLLLASSALWPVMIYPATLLFGASMVLLEVNLLTAFRLYQKHAKLAPKSAM